MIIKNKLFNYRNERMSKLSHKMYHNSFTLVSMLLIYCIVNISIILLSGRQVLLGSYDGCYDQRRCRPSGLPKSLSAYGEFHTHRLHSASYTHGPPILNIHYACTSGSLHINLPCNEVYLISQHRRTAAK